MGTVKLEDMQLRKFQLMLLDLGKIFRDVCDEAGIWYSLDAGSLLGAVREKGFIPWDGDLDMIIKYEDRDRFREAFAKHQFDGVKLVNYDNKPYCLKSHDMLVSHPSSDFPDVILDIYPIIGAPGLPKEKQDRIVRRWNYEERITRSKYVNISESKMKFLVAGAKIIDALIPDKVLYSYIKKRETKFDRNETGFWMTSANWGPGRTCIPISTLDGYTTISFEGEEFKILSGWDTYLRIKYGDDYMTPKRY